MNRAATVVLGVLLGLLLIAGAVLANGWLFMLAVGNLGLNFGYGDSVFTAWLLVAVFAGSNTIANRRS